MTDVNTDGALMVAACTSGDEATENQRDMLDSLRESSMSLWRPGSPAALVEAISRVSDNYRVKRSSENTPMTIRNVSTTPSGRSPTARPSCVMLSPASPSTRRSPGGS